MCAFPPVTIMNTGGGRAAGAFHNTHIAPGEETSREFTPRGRASGQGAAEQTNAGKAAAGGEREPGGMFR